MKKIVALYEKEEAYGRNLAEYANRKENMPFEIHVFSQGNKLREYLKEQSPYMIILSESSKDELYMDIEEAKEVVYLSKHKENNAKTHIYKYQSIDKVFEQIINHINEKEKNTMLEGMSSSVYGIYSPIGRCAKTTAALLIGETLSKNSSVLYLGFDELPVFDEYEQSEPKSSSTLSDAYFFYQKNELESNLASLVTHWHSVDMIDGMNCPEDLSGVSAVEWVNFTKELAASGKYGTLILDLGTKLWLSSAFFEICTHIFIPTLQDRYSIERQKMFDDWSERNCSEVIREKMEKIQIPMSNQNKTQKECLEYALWSEAGDYIRNLFTGLHCEISNQIRESDKAVIWKKS